MNANGIHDQLLDHHHPDLNRNSEFAFERPNLSSRRRSSSAGRQAALQIRAGSLVKKIGILTSKLGAGARFKQSSTSDTKSDANLRKAQSMDVLRTKQPYMLAGFEPQPFVRNSTDGSKESENDASDSKFGHARKPSSSNSIAHSLAVTAMVAGASVRPPAPECSLKSPSSPRSADLSNSSNNATTELNTDIRNTDTFETLAPPMPEKRRAHPRLSTLPPLNFNLKGLSQEQQSQRLSPSVIVRPPPFPILELPALPTPVAQTSVPDGHAQSRRRRGGAHLNSMPLLPREGSDERENDPDHENCILDEDEEGDDEDNDEDGMSGEADAAGTEEDDDESGTNGRRSRASFSNVPPSPTSSFLSRTRGLSPRLTLSGLSTPSLSTLLNLTIGTPSPSNPQQSSGDVTSANLSHIRPGSSAVGNPERNPEPMTGSRDDASTPKAMRANHIWDGMGNGSAHTDYFSTSGADNPNSQGIDPTLPSSDDKVNLPLPLSSTSNTLRTPAAHDYPAFQTPMISVVRPETAPSGVEVRAFNDSGFEPKGLVSDAQVPHLGLKSPPSKRRPSIYHHAASKSMIELFSVSGQTTEPAVADAVGRTASDRDVKGKGKLTPKALVGENLQLLTSEDDILRTPGQDRNAKRQDKPLLPVTPTSSTQSGGAPSLRRQHSMPTFGTAGEPPPYPTFLLPYHLQKFVPSPREDEGKEELPPYNNSIRLEAIMPRKMEFAAPGVPARDRKWRRVHCILEGTAFRVYDCPPRASGVSVLGGWWERKVGVGDVASGPGVAPGTSAGPGATTNIIISRKEPKRRMKWEEELAAQEEAQGSADSGTDERRSCASTPTSEANEHPKGHKSKRRVVAHLLHPSSRHSLDHGSSFTPASPRTSFHFPRSSVESSSNPPSARPSMDITTIAVSSSGLMASMDDSASSNSLSATSSNTGASTPNAQRRRRGHLRSDSAQSRSSCGHSRSNSRVHSPLNPDSLPQQAQSHSHSQSQTQMQNPDPTINPYLYHPPDSSELPKPDEKNLLRVYTLQKCECGLASDYLKRKNVVRVRMEGEQFLLQCKDVPSVVEWIEGLQAAANIALDLDARPMPKGPIFPRRRRRRRPQPSAPAAESGNGPSGRAAAS